MTPDLIGYGAAVLTTTAFLPQALKSWISRDLTGISLTMYSLFTLGVGLWLAYGIALHSWPIILGNGINYPIILFSRYQEFRARGMPSDAARREAVMRR